MAYTESGELEKNTTYNLGNYSITFRDANTEETHIIRARIEGPESHASNSVTLPDNTKVLNWYIEANEDTVDVYATIAKVKKDSAGSVENPTIDGFTYEGIVAGAPLSGSQEVAKDTILTISGVGLATSRNRTVLYASPSNDVDVFIKTSIHSPGGGKGSYLPGYNARAYTRNGKTAYYGSEYSVTLGTKTYYYADVFSPSETTISGLSDGLVAWILCYGLEFDEIEEEETILVARFPIDLGEAGGGPDGDWDDPEDYDPEEDPIEYGDPDYPDPDDPDYPEPIEYGDPDYPDPDDPDYPDPIEWGDPDYPDPEDPDYPGDQDGDGIPDPYHPDYHPDYYPPTKTLYLTVTGATSGTHESGITAAPNEIIADYGCGGNGGHGGGGGAGSSTVVIHKFATSKANSKEVTAISQLHGYGSGGGKGGKGGDGIILIYY